MDDMFVPMLYLLLIAILPIVVLFKMWGMANNVKKITKIMENHFNPPEVVEKEVKNLDGSISKGWSSD